MRVEEMEFGGRLVFEKLRRPVRIRHGGKRAGDRLPFCYAKAGFGEPGQATEYHDTEDAGGGPEEPVADGVGRSVWEARCLCPRGCF